MNELIQKVLANILTIMTKTSLSAPFYEAVLKRLVSLGYNLKTDDGWMICFALQKVENHIKNSCNTTSVPDGLFNVAVDMVCGEFIFTKKQTGKLELTVRCIFSFCISWEISRFPNEPTFSQSSLKGC